MSKIVIQNLDNVNDLHFAINIFDLTWEIKNGSEITPNLLKAMINETFMSKMIGYARVSTFYQI